MSEESKTKKENKSLVKREVVQLDIPRNIPEKEIILKQLEDGYSITTKHSSDVKKDNYHCSSSYAFSSERHFGRKVKNVSGGFSKDGVYEISLDFGDE